MAPCMSQASTTVLPDGTGAAPSRMRHRPRRRRPDRGRLKAVVDEAERRADLHGNGRRVWSMRTSTEWLQGGHRRTGRSLLSSRAPRTGPAVRERHRLGNRHRAIGAVGPSTTTTRDELISRHDHQPAIRATLLDLQCSLLEGSSGAVAVTRVPISSQSSRAGIRTRNTSYRLPWRRASSPSAAFPFRRVRVDQIADPGACERQGPTQLAEFGATQTGSSEMSGV